MTQVLWSGSRPNCGARSAVGEGRAAACRCRSPARLRGYLARAGARVILLDAARFPRPHVGESLVPAANRVLAELGIWLAHELGFVSKHGAIWSTSTSRGSSPTMASASTSATSPMLQNARAAPRGRVAESRYQACSPRSARWIGDEADHDNRHDRVVTGQDVAQQVLVFSTEMPADRVVGGCLHPLQRAAGVGQVLARAGAVGLGRSGRNDAHLQRQGHLRRRG